MSSDLNAAAVGAWSDAAAADLYERSRPLYADAAVEAIVDRLALNTSSRVVDIGAGTGKLSRQIAPHVGEVIAVEPLEGMRRIFAASVPGVEIRAGRAEALPIDDGSVDAVVSGQAWHWFDSERALSEAKRVLRPGGGIGFFWNDYDENSDLLREVAELRKRYSNGEPTQTENTWREPIDTSEVWGPLNEETFAHTMRVDISSMTERALSSSVIARRPAAERQRIQHEIEEIILRHAGGHDQIDVAYITLVYWTRLR